VSKKFNVAEIMASLDREVAQELQDTADRTAGALVYATPVGNPSLWQSKAPASYVPGHARRNWHATIGSKSSSELPGVDASGQVALMEIRAAVKEWVNRSGKHEKFYIQNNVPYIERLNDGWSSQAPAGFVEKAILAANGVNTNERKLLK
jgi:hypothetical protein